MVSCLECVSLVLCGEVRKRSLHLAARSTLNLRVSNGHTRTTCRRLADVNLTHVDDVSGCCGGSCVVASCGRGGISRVVCDRQVTDVDQLSTSLNISKTLQIRRHDAKNIQNENTSIKYTISFS